MKSPQIEVQLPEKEIFFKKLEASTPLEIFLNAPEELVFCADIYAFQPQIHPEKHLGWWAFKFENGKHHLTLQFDFSTIDEHSLRIFKAGEEVKHQNFWVNPSYSLEPLQDCKLVFWNKNKIVYLKRNLMKIEDERILKSFYDQQYKTEGYAPTSDRPFLDLLHHYKLRILKKYFERCFKGLVLDVGCGLSLFTEIQKKWNFKIIAGDLVFGRIKDRKQARPDIQWIVFDASHLPFKSRSIDSIFAGEILEHLPGAEQAIKEWNRVHKTKGILVVTTPNRDRRINKINKDNWAYSPDHLREISYNELNKTLLPKGGYRPLKKKGIYLEIFTRSNKWWHEDYLQREGNVKSNARLMKILFRLGYWFPRNSLVLMTVARKL
jgi:ubiquinone/menaquinone biosynthesis C-methylase UbiE